MFKEVHLNVKLLRMLENVFVKQLYGRQVLITFNDHFDMLNAFTTHTIIYVLALLSLNFKNLFI